MRSKVCTKCGRELPISEFVRSSSGYFQSWCKECKGGYAKEYYTENREKIKAKAKEYYLKRKEKLNTLAKREEEERRRNFKLDVLGGYKMYYLTHVKQGERRFNAVSTDGRVFKTNDKQEFIRFLEAI